jgi:hypothetical protein
MFECFNIALLRFTMASCGAKMVSPATSECRSRGTDSGPSRGEARSSPPDHARRAGGRRLAGGLAMGAGSRPHPPITGNLPSTRALVGLSQEDLAQHSGASAPTVKRLEASEGDIGGRAETGQALIASLEEAGVEFIAENGGGAGVRLTKRQRRVR